MIGLRDDPGSVPARINPDPVGVSHAPALAAKAFAEHGWLQAELHLEHRPQQEQMARAVAGGEARLRAEPPISALLGTVTPLGNDAGTLETGLAFAAAGIPIGFVTMPMGGSTTPITMAGSLVVGMAEALSAVAMIQAAHPGAGAVRRLASSADQARCNRDAGAGPVEGEIPELACMT